MHIVRKVSKKSKPKIRIKFGNIFTLITVIITIVATFEFTNFLLNVNAKQIVVSDNNFKLTYEASGKNVQDFLKHHNIALSEYDRVNVSLSESLKDGMQISIKRAMPVILLKGDESVEYFTSASTIYEFLKEREIAIKEEDYVSPDVSFPITPGLYIIYKEGSIKQIEETVNIPYSVDIQKTSTLKKGEEEIVTQGVQGKKKVLIDVKYVGEEEVSRTVVREEILESPINKVVKQGTLEVYTAPNGKTYTVKETLMMTATAYTNGKTETGKEPGDPGYGITRSGTVAKVGTVAVDPSVIKLGTKLYVEGYGEATAEDTGSAIKGHIIDLFVNTREEALRFGRKKNIKVYILAN